MKLDPNSVKRTALHATVPVSKATARGVEAFGPFFSGKKYGQVSKGFLVMRVERLGVGIASSI